MKYTAITILCLMLTACAEKVRKENVDPGSIRNEITTLMQEQEDEWNRSNIDGFMKHYWNSDSLVFVGSRGPTYGWTNTLANYHKSYPDTLAMGKLRFTNIRMDVLDADKAYVIGKWELFRSADTLGGHYSLLWRKISGHWVIVADHSS